MNGPSDSSGKPKREPLKPREPAGNFNDLERLLDELGSPPVFELGYPVPQDRYLPRRAGICPAAHNCALLGDDAA